MVQSVGSVLISDGASSANVNNGRLQVRPKSRFQVAVDNGDAYTWTCVTKDWAAGDTLIGVENNETTKLLYIEKVIVSTDASSRTLVFGTSGVTVAGTNAIVGVNLNRGSGNVAKATCVDDETGNGEAVATWPTRFAETYLLTGQTHTFYFGGAVVIQPDGMIGVDLVADTTGGNATVIGWFE